MKLGKENDIVYAGKGKDRIYGGNGDDILFGESHRDILAGQTGIDQLFGGKGNDRINGGSGNDLIMGGKGNDRLIDGQGNDILAGGRGNDKLKLKDGINTVLYNRGDGIDTLKMGNHLDGITLSLGADINLDDISLQQDGDHLKLQFANNKGQFTGKSAIVLSDWYNNCTNKNNSSAQKPSLTLQLFDNNHSPAVSQYDLNTLIQTFDNQSTQKSPDTEIKNQWQITHAAMDALLSISDDEALGGDLAYGYAIKTSINPFAASTIETLDDQQFGLSGQHFEKN